MAVERKSLGKDWKCNSQYSRRDSTNLGYDLHTSELSTLHCSKAPHQTQLLSLLTPHLLLKPC